MREIERHFPIWNADLWQNLEEFARRATDLGPEFSTSGSPVIRGVMPCCPESQRRMGPPPRIPNYKGKGSEFDAAGSALPVRLTGWCTATTKVLHPDLPSSPHELRRERARAEGAKTRSERA